MAKQPRAAFGLGLLGSGGASGPLLVSAGALAMLCFGPMLEGADGSLLSALRPSAGSFTLADSGLSVVVVIAFALAFVMVTAFGAPGLPLLMLVAGASLGLTWGIALCCVAALAGAALPLILFRDRFKARMRVELGALATALERKRAGERERWLFMLWLVPALRRLAIESPAGLDGMSARSLLRVGALAMLMGTAVYVNAGVQLASVGSLADLWRGPALVAFAALLIYPLAVRLTYAATSGLVGAGRGPVGPAPKRAGHARGGRSEAATVGGTLDDRHRALILFGSVRDREGFARSAARFVFDDAGFDLFSFPSNAHVARFDIERFVERLARRAQRSHWHSVVSTHEQFGALCAAMLAERLQLPGTSPRAVLAAQHKLFARQVLDRVAPEANVGYRLLDCEYGEPVPEGLDYPCFVKPVKAAFSVLARKADSHAALQAMMRFGPFELWTIRHLVEPFERIARVLLPEAGSSHRMLVEEWIDAPQYNLDGYVFGGDVHLIGVIDAHMYPGTQAFMRWDYPSRLAPEVTERALDVARRFLAAIGFTHGMFNMEFFYDPEDDRLAVVEFNPRMSSQPADLYRRVDGVDMHAMALALGEGTDPARAPRLMSRGRVSASFVFRTFDPGLRPVLPAEPLRAELARRFPGSLLITYPRGRIGIARDFKWLGSHRYALLHLEGDSEAHLRQRCLEACALLGWPAPYEDRATGVTARST